MFSIILGYILLSIISVLLTVCLEYVNSLHLRTDYIMNVYTFSESYAIQDITEPFTKNKLKWFNYIMFIMLLITLISGYYVSFFWVSYFKDGLNYIGVILNYVLSFSFNMFFVIKVVDFSTYIGRSFWNNYLERYSIKDIYTDYFKAKYPKVHPLITTLYTTSNRLDFKETFNQKGSQHKNKIGLSILGSILKDLDNLIVYSSQNNEDLELFTKLILEPENIDLFSKLTIIIEDVELTNLMVEKELNKASLKYLDDLWIAVNNIEKALKSRKKSADKNLLLEKDYTNKTKDNLARERLELLISQDFTIK